MRSAFVKCLSALAEKNPLITLITGDLGFGVLDDFARRFPSQFVNAGVAEQNMSGLAAGMALAGRRVFTYSIGNFPTLRCLEQIRNDICYHNLDVTIVAVGGGLSYGSLGISHHATEDLAIMRTMPNLTVVAPGDPEETIRATEAVASHRGPCYLRLGRAGEPKVHKGAIEFSLGRSILLREGCDLTLVSTGGMLATAVATADILAEQGVAARVISMHTLKPLDTKAITAAARETGLLVTLEEHSILGGLGGAVAEHLSELAGMHAPLRRVGLPTKFTSEVGSQDYLKGFYGLTPAAISSSAKQWLQEITPDAVQRHRDL